MKMHKPGRIIIASADKVTDFVSSSNETSNYLVEIAKSLKSGVMNPGECKVGTTSLTNSLAEPLTDSSEVVFTDLRVYFSTLEAVVEFDELKATLEVSSAPDVGVVYMYLTDTGEVIHTTEKSSISDPGSILLLAYSATGIVLLMDMANGSSVNYSRYVDLIIKPYLASWVLKGESGASGSSFNYITEGSSTLASMMSGVVTLGDTSNKKSATCQSDGSGGLIYEPFISTANGILQFAGKAGGHGFTEGSYIGVTFYFNLGTQSILSVLEPDSKGSVGEAMNPLILSGYNHESALGNNFHLAVGKLVIKVTADKDKLEVSTDSPNWVPSTSQDDMMALVLKSVVTWGTGL